MKTLRVILKDQLSQSISSLAQANKDTDVILMCETLDEFTHVKHHKKKIVFLISAMRHFANELKEAGFNVVYVTLNDKANTHNISKEVKRVVEAHNIERVVITEPSEYYLLQAVKTWEEGGTAAVEIKPDDRFLCTVNEFKEWAKGKQNLRMEYFYREMRKKYSILMEGSSPVGGQWNYDAENRKVPKEGLNIPKPYNNAVDAITQDAINLVEEEFQTHFGDVYPFYFAVTRSEALEALQLFIQERLHSFGDYQDAMLSGEPWMYHSHISFYINCGLLLPLECVEVAEKAYHQGKAPLNAVEGFIRQIIGWREYIRGIYWVKMPEYTEENFLNATKKLPEFYWTAQTDMNCLKQCVSETKQNAYAHHIQRLMVLGNFALLAGVDPKYVNEWFWIVYADAYEWVELPNVSGMILFADGGYLASKPYAAGGSYINKMSNYCKGCAYKVSKKNGEDACPFNYLYWNFLATNREKLHNNHRVGMMYKTYDRMADDKKDEIAADSQRFLNNL